MRSIVIKEDVKVPGTNVVLEKGDSIAVLNEDSYNVELVDELVNKFRTMDRGEQLAVLIKAYAQSNKEFGTDEEAKQFLIRDLKSLIISDLSVYF